MIYAAPMGLLLRLREAWIKHADVRDDTDTLCPVCDCLVPAGEGVPVSGRRCCTVEHAKEWQSIARW